MEDLKPCRFCGGPAHPDDEAVDRFAAAMKAKLAQKRTEGRGGWDNKATCSQEFLSFLLREHVEKGDPVDVASFAMMLHQRGETIMVPVQDAPARQPSVQEAAKVLLDAPRSTTGPLAYAGRVAEEFLEDVECGGEIATELIEAFLRALAQEEDKG